MPGGKRRPPRVTCTLGAHGNVDPDSIEDVERRQSSKPFWFQLYVMKRPRLHTAR